MSRTEQAGINIKYQADGYSLFASIRLCQGTPFKRGSFLTSFVRVYRAMKFASELGSIRPRLAGLQNGKVNLSERDFRCQKTGTRVLRKMCLARFLAARFPIRRPVLLHD